jgi:hypothetical protein
MGFLYLQYLYHRHTKLDTDQRVPLFSFLGFDMRTFTSNKQKMTYAPFSKYLKLIAGLGSFSLITVATINYTVNPGKIYPPLPISDSYNRLSPKQIVKQLVQSDHGLIVTNDTWNERDLKHALALRPTTSQCAVIGSSRVMQISSSRKERSLSDICPSLINLGVSGASLEDFLALSETILRNEKPPKVIVFGIDLSNFNFNRDSRWISHKQKFFNIKSKLEGEYPEDNSFSTLALIRNLINREYLLRSIKLLRSGKTRPFKNAQKFDHQVGLDNPLLLPDGSLIYSDRYDNRASEIIGIPLGNVIKIRGSRWVNEKAVELFIRLVNHLQQKKFKIIFVLVPYHPAVWDIAEQFEITEINIVESKVHEIGRLTGVQVIGSYNPSHIECTAFDFFELSHPKSTCLTKLERASVFYRTSKD